MINLLIFKLKYLMKLPSDEGSFLVFFEINFMISELFFSVK